MIALRFAWRRVRTVSSYRSEGQAWILETECLHLRKLPVGTGVGSRPIS